MTKNKERNYLVVTLNEINDAAEHDSMHVLATDPEQAVLSYIDMLDLKVQPGEFLDVHVLDIGDLQPTYRLESVLKITPT